MAKKPLEGLRVLDLGIVQAGPFITRYMGDWGAEVIRVESRAHADPSRISQYPENTPGAEFWNQGATFHEQMRGKLSVTLEFDNPKGVELLKRLVAVSDVLEESYPPRVMKQFGLDYESIKDVNPGLVYISSLGYGHGGPYEAYRNYGMITEAMSGISWLNGYEGGPPARSAIPYTDHPSTYMGFFAVMAALEQRRWTGKGQWVNLSQYEVGIHMIGDVYVEHSLTGETPPRLGNRHSDMAPHGVYPCQGDAGWITVAVRNDDDWAALRRALGDPDWARDAQFEHLDGRLRHGAAIDAGIAAWAAERDGYEAQAHLQRHGVPCGVTLGTRTLMVDPHLRERGFYKMVEHDPAQERVGRRPFPGPSAIMGETPGAIDRPAPMMGQHNEYVLSGILGLSKKEIEGLEAEGVVGTRPTYADIRPDPPLSAQDRMNMAGGVGRIRGHDPDYRARLGIDSAEQTGGGARQ